MNPFNPDSKCVKCEADREEDIEPIPKEKLIESLKELDNPSPPMGR